MTVPSEASFVPPRFGTDGLRGRAGDAPLDPETLRRVGASLGVYLQRSGPELKRVVVGNDGRESSPWILDALTQGLMSASASVVDIGLTTTPALAHVTRSQAFVAGVMISASHNPASDNGIKLFDSRGGKLSDAAQSEIEGLTSRLEVDENLDPRPREDARLLDQYIADIANDFGGLDLQGATVVVDGANGGGSSLAPTVLRTLGADVVEVCCEPDGFNINDGCGATHPDHLAQTVVNSGAILGICLDGDGDRSIFVDDQGAIHDGDNVLATLGPWLKQNGQLPHDTLVATVMSNLGLRKLLAADGIRVEMTAVGDRNVAARMREGGFALGAEQSGHVLFDRGDHLVGDGLFTTLQILSLPGIREKGASSVFRAFQRFPQLLVNVEVNSKPPLDDIPAVVAERERIEKHLGDDGRVVLRYSGTEQLCRVMIEGPDEAEVKSLTDGLAELIRRELD